MLEMKHLPLVAVTLSFFFFSSRRRHTSGLSDWSSDVCSSDLPCRLPPRVPPCLPKDKVEPVAETKHFLSTDNRHAAAPSCLFLSLTRLGTPSQLLCREQRSPRPMNAGVADTAVPPAPPRA